MVQKDNYDKAKDISQIISLIAIPVLIALGGWMIQKSIKDQEIKRDYLKLAVEILSKNPVNDDLRKWALTVFNSESPIQLTPSAAENMFAGVIPPMDDKTAASCYISFKMNSADDVLALDEVEKNKTIVRLFKELAICKIKHDAAVKYYNTVRDAFEGAGSNKDNGTIESAP